MRPKLLLNPVPVNARTPTLQNERNETEVETGNVEHGSFCKVAIRWDLRRVKMMMTARMLMK